MRIRMDDVTPGMKLETPIVKNDVILVKAGEVLTPHIINRLKNTFYIEELNIVSENQIQDNSYANTISEEIINACKDALVKNDIIKIEESATDMVEAVLNNVDFEGSFSNLKYDLESTTKNKNILDDSLNHSIRVATFSIILAYLYNNKIKERIRDKDELNRRLINYNSIAVASLMHDSGKYLQNEELLNEVRRVVAIKDLDKTFKNINNIPTDRFDNQYAEFYSYCLTNKFKSLPSDLRIMILYSNEAENNAGPLKSPLFLREKEHPGIVGAKIIHLCSLYDDYLSHCINTQAALENIMAILGQSASNGVINKDLTNLFLDNVPIYPIGTKVILSNNEEGVVVKTFTDYTYATRPTVKLNNGQIIRLKDTTSIVVVGINNGNNAVDDLVNDQLGEVDRKVTKH